MRQALYQRHGRMVWKSETEPEVATRVNMMVHVDERVAGSRLAAAAILDEVRSDDSTSRTKMSGRRRVRDKARAADCVVGSNRIAQKLRASLPAPGHNNFLPLCCTLPTFFLCTSPDISFDPAPALDSADWKLCDSISS